MPTWRGLRGLSVLMPELKLMRSDARRVPPLKDSRSESKLGWNLAPQPDFAEGGAQKCPRQYFDAKTEHETMAVLLYMHEPLFL